MKSSTLALLVLSVAALAGFVWWNRGATPAVSNPGVCPEFSHFPQELTGMTIEALEQKSLAVRVYPPTMAKQKLVELRTLRDTLPEAERACMYKTELVRAVYMERHLGGVGETWGETREVDELRKLFLETPMTKNWSAEQRQQAMDWVEKEFVARNTDPGDADYFRRMYLGAVLLCEATDEGLKSLHMRRRPMTCPRVVIR